MTKGTIIRTIILLVALINQLLVAFGKSPLPIDDIQIETLISTAFTIIASMIAWWKNNSVTEEARKADEFLAMKKAEKKIIQGK